MPESSPLRPARRPHSAAPAAIAVAVLVLTGCTAPEEEHPLASPMSDTAVPAAEPTPAYTTELQLSEEEKTAVDEALTVLHEFVDLSNDVYSSGGEGADEFEKLASDAVLFKAKQEAEQFSNDGIRMYGNYRLKDIGIHEVDLNRDDETQIPFVTIHSCVPVSEYSFSGSSPSSSPASPPEFDTFGFVIADYDDSWYVSEQYLWTDGCELN